MLSIAILSEDRLLQAIFKIISAARNVIFGNLSLLLDIGKKDKDTINEESNYINEL